MAFGVVNFLQKTNENKSIIVERWICSLVFLEKIVDPKNHFEINWPLIKMFIHQKKMYIFGLNQLLVTITFDLINKHHWKRVYIKIISKHTCRLLGK